MTNDKLAAAMADLSAPFEESELEYRIQSSGMKNGRPWARVLTYVANRAIMNRFDSVFGLDGWQNRFETTADGILCGIGVRVSHTDGTVEWIWRWDGASMTDVEPFKGGVSGAMKRAAVQFGVGRYLYNLDATWANFSADGAHRDFIRKSKGSNDGEYYNWDPPPLPGWALPGGSGVPPAAAATKKASPAAGGGPGRAPASAPASAPAVECGAGGVTTDQLQRALERAYEIGLGNGQFKMTFQVLVGRVTKAGRVDIDALTPQEYERVLRSFDTREGWEAAIAAAAGEDNAGSRAAEMEAKLKGGPAAVEDPAADSLLAEEEGE